MSIEKEFKEIGSFYTIDRLDNLSNNFKIIYDVKNKEYLKVYHKKVFKNQYREPIHKDIDHLNILLNFFKDNTYNFLSEFKYETKNYIAFKYYFDYKKSKLKDYVDLSIKKLEDILNIPIENKKCNITKIFKTIIKNFKSMYENEKLELLLSDEAKKFANFKSKSKTLNYLTITPSSITLNNILFKKNKNNKIIDWKYIDMENIEICFPRYIFNLNDTKLYPINKVNPDVNSSKYMAGDDKINLEDINKITDKPCVFCTFEYKWYNIGEIKNY